MVFSKTLSGYLLNDRTGLDIPTPFISKGGGFDLHKTIARSAEKTGSAEDWLPQIKHIL
jgi:hypothetical protein